MNGVNISPKRQALKFLQEALDTGVRGNVRTHIKAALDELTGAGAKELTSIEYERLQDGKVLLDPKRSGLLMRAGGRKGKRWIYRYRDPTQDNKQVEYQFGTFPAMPLSEARDTWLQLRSMRNEGKSPRGAGGHGAALTVRQLVKLYLDEYSDKKKRASTFYQDRRILTTHVLPHYGDMPAANFGRDEAKAIVNKIVQAGATRQAQKVRSTIRTMFDVATRSSYEWLPPDHQNPVFNIDIDHKTVKREPVKPETLRHFLRGLDELGVYGDALRLQVETFCRISEPAGLLWAELDLDAGVWYLPAKRTKTNSPHKVMLARQTVERLRKLKETSNTPHVFPAPSSPAMSIRTTTVVNKLGAASKSGITPTGYTSHVSRHAGLTWIAEQGQTRDLRDRLTNHKPPSDGTDHIYNAAQLDRPAREWTQRWVDYLTALEADNVVSMVVQPYAG